MAPPCVQTLSPSATTIPTAAAAPTSPANSNAANNRNKLPTASNAMQHMSAPTAATTPASRPPAEETHKCPYPSCGKFFSKKYNLKAHLRLHTGEQPFECPRPDCRKRFKWRSSLSSHAVWHTRKEAGLKRPRAEGGNATTGASAAKAAPPPVSVATCIPVPPVAPVIRKKRRGEDAALAALDAAMALPGSPVTSESDKSLDVELFQGAVLPPLSTVSAVKMEDELLVHEGDVNAAILADSDLFYTPSGDAGVALDTRFGPFELDNLQGYCTGSSVATKVTSHGGATN